MTRLVLIGGGRLAGILYAAFHRQHEILGYVDDVYPDAYLTQTYQVPCLGASVALEELKSTGAKVVVAIMDPKVRRKYWELVERLGLEAETLVFPTAVIDPFARIGAGCIIRHQAVVSAQARLGKNCVVSDLAYVGHDTVVGDHCYLSPGSKLNGSVAIGDQTFVGTNAVVLPERSVGSRCTVAASACVTEDVPDDGRVAGVPARPLPVKHTPAPAIEWAGSRPLVSVLMSAYNHEKFVGEAIQSVLDQTFQDFEFLIVDDGSTDRTVDVIRQFQDPRIRFSPLGRNHGISEAKNILLEQARGSYVAIQNSDDVHLPQKLGAQVRFMQENPGTAVVFTHAEVIDERGAPLPLHGLSSLFREKNRPREAWLRRFFLEGNCLCAPSALMNRERLAETGYLDRRLRQIQDLDLWIRICMKHPIHILEEPLTRFRVRDGNANASAASPEVLVRVAWEYTRILRNYLQIPDEATLVRIFPELAGQVVDGAPMDRDSIAYLVAALALSVGQPRCTCFALETLHDLLGDTARARRIQERFGFGYRELIEHTGRLDLFATLGRSR